MRGAENSVAMSRDLTNSLTGAIQDYRTRQDKLAMQAKLDEERKAKQAMDIGFIQQEAVMGNPLTPAQQAKLDIYMADKMSQVSVDPTTGLPYQKYQPTGVLAGMVGGQPQEAGGTFGALQQAGAGQLLPPPTQQDMGDMPTPIGEQGVTEADLLQGVEANPAIAQKAKEEAIKLRGQEMMESRKERKAKASEARTFIRSLPSQIKELDSLNETIDKAIVQSNWSNTGGYIRGNLPIAPSLDANVKRVAANEFISNLLQAKDKGATFGALDRNEAEKLESLRGSLTRAQSEEQLDSTLNQLKEFHQDYKQRLLSDADEAAAQGFVDPKQVEMLKKSLEPKASGITQNPKAQEIKAQYQAGKITKEQARGMLKTLGSK